MPAASNVTHPSQPCQINDEKLLSAQATIRAITDDNQLNDAEKVERIRTLLNAHEARVSEAGSISPP